MRHDRLKIKYQVDWFRVITDLDRIGFGLQSLSKHTGICRVTLSNYKNGNTMPKHHDGEVIIDLWCRLMEIGRDGVPMTKVI